MSNRPFSYLEFPARPTTAGVAFSFHAVGRIPYRTDKIIPTGLVVMVFTFGAAHRVGANPIPERNPAFADGWVQGNWTRPLFHTPLNGTDVVGLAMPPQSLMRLTGLPTLNLTDRIVPCAELIPATVCDAMRAMRPSADDARAHTDLHHLVQATMRHPLPGWVDTVHRAIIDTRGQLSFPDLYRRLPVSARTVRDRFKAAIGLTPRQCARIQRLLALLDTVDPSKKVDWTTLAHAHGFFDQPHFNHEFSKLTGLTPSQYLEDRRRAWPRARKGEHVSFAPEGLP